MVYLFHQKISQAKLPENVQKVAMKELKRIKKMSPQMPEYPMLRHYLELISELPWNKASTDRIDIRKAREVNFRNKIQISERVNEVDFSGPRL